MMNWQKEGCLPHWHIFCEDTTDLPNVLKWRAPSTMWESWPMVAFMSETAFMDNDARSWR